MVLTAERAREVLSYNQNTGKLSWRKSTGKKAKVGKEAGSITRLQVNRHVAVRVDGKAYRAHRVIWLIVYGEWPTDDVDHANGDATDNRLCNLLGIAPEDLEKKVGKGPIPSAGNEVVAGVPAELLARRPDIRQAERQAAEAGPGRGGPERRGFGPREASLFDLAQDGRAPCEL